MSLSTSTAPFPLWFLSLTVESLRKKAKSLIISSCRWFKFSIFVYFKFLLVFIMFLTTFPRILIMLVLTCDVSAFFNLVSIFEIGALLILSCLRRLSAPKRLDSFLLLSDPLRLLLLAFSVASFKIIILF